MYIDKLEVLRYLGYKNQSMDEKIEGILNECIAETYEIIKKSFVYDIYDIQRLGDAIALRNTNLVFHSKNLEKLLQKSDRCVMMAATLGLEADKRIGYYSRMELTKGVIMDACATTAIEALCDEVQEEIRLKAEAQGYCITSRYSPGYGDLPITHQRDIIEVLKAYPKIGLTVNESSIMLPRKSVTALIGWQRYENTVEKEKCQDCKDMNCMYRKCGNTNE